MNKDILLRFIRSIKYRQLLTEFISSLFDYDNFNDYNYLFRITSEEDRVIIDIYDNVSDNRFNRYIFIFSDGEYDVKITELDSVFVTSMYVYNLSDGSNKLYKLGYLFSLDNKKMIEYAKTFLDNKFVVILQDVINKFISQS